MSIDTERVGQTVVLIPGDRIDTVTAPAFERALLSSLSEGLHCVVDMTNVTYISSAGLGAFVKGAKRAGERACRFALAGLHGEPRRVFDITNLRLFFELFPTREEALVALTVAGKVDETNGSAAPAQGAPLSLAPSLTLAEEILLLALEDEQGRYIDLPPHSLDHALAGALLMELCMGGKIDLDMKRLVCVDRSPIGDDLLDPVLDAIARSGDERSAQQWIRTLVRDGREIERRVVHRLIARNVLAREASGLRRVLGGPRHRMKESHSQREVKQRLLEVITSETIPLPRDIVLIALAEACAVFDAVLDEDAMLDARPRILEIAGMDLLALSMLEVLVGVQREGDVEPPVVEIFGRPDAQHVN